MKLSPTKIATAISLSVYGLMALPAQVMAVSGAPAKKAAGKIEIGTIESSGGFATDIGSVITTLLSFVMGIAALLVFFYLIWGGITWITSGGEKGKTEEARNKITSAVIGLIVLAASYAILMIVLRVLGFDSLSDTLTNIKPIVTEGSQTF